MLIEHAIFGKGLVTSSAIGVATDLLERVLRPPFQSNSGKSWYRFAAGSSENPNDEPDEKRGSLAGSALLSMEEREANAIMGHISFEVKFAGYAFKGGFR
eukprot:1160885-Pelagomonas_calceolata.AAC.2